MHIKAQSGQVHDISISLGAGNNPAFCWHTRSMTAWDKRPCKSSTSESIEPEQSVQIDVHRAAGKGSTLTVTWYIDEPITFAWTTPPLTCRSRIEPLRT